jgi:hypothetical protein
MENTYRRRIKCKIYLASNENGSDNECRRVGGYVRRKCSCYALLYYPAFVLYGLRKIYELPVGITICSRTENSASGACTDLNSCALSDR